MSSIMNLPPEVLVVIFKKLSFRDVIENCAKVSDIWQAIIAENFVQPYLVKLANYDQDMKKMLKKRKWSENCTNSEMIMSVYKLPKVKDYPGKCLILRQKKLN